MSIVYSSNIERNPEGDTALVKEFMAELNAVCDNNHGHHLMSKSKSELGHHRDKPSPTNRSELAETPEYARQNYMYMVGAALVENIVDLFNGHKSTHVLCELGQDIEALIAGFNEVYGEENIYKREIIVPQL